MKARKTTIILFGLAIVASGLLIGIKVADRHRADLPSEGVTALANPAGAGARYPFVVAAPGGETVLMSWLEPPIEGSQSERTSLLWAAFDGTAWSTPEVITEGDDFFTNWADFPSLAVAANQPMAAHWLRKVPGSTYAYHVAMAFRSSSGAWSDPFAPHADKSATEHGFASLVPIEGAGVLATWLDGYRTATSPGGEAPSHAHGGAAQAREAMTLHAAMVYPDGSTGEEIEVDASVCDCCQTSAARSGNRVIVVYRDRTPGEIRDTWRAVYDLGGNTWREPEALSTEGWEIAGCPVNGPQVAAHGETVIAAWFSAPDNQPRSYMAVSRDGGLSFGNAQALDTKASAGRVGVTFNPDGEALLTWIGSGQRGSVVYGRIWRHSGLGAPFVIGGIDGSRASGFPRAASIGGDFLVAWTVPEGGSSVQTVIVSAAAH